LWAVTSQETYYLSTAELNRLMLFGESVAVYCGVTGGWGMLHNEELHNLYPSPSIITIIKSSRMRWAGHVARMGEKRNVYRLLVGKIRGKETTRKTET
jgi:hypothetical protein